MKLKISDNPRLAYDKDNIPWEKKADGTWHKLEPKMVFQLKVDAR